MQSASHAPPAPAEAAIGGRYLIERTLGKGGIGVVYAVFDQGTGQRVALKRLLSDDPRTRRLFEHEYRTLAALRHPGIVEAFDYGVDDEGPFYTMELLDGQDLSSAAPRPWPEVCACMREVAAIVGMLHARRLVHRDISPRNLWRTPDGRIKLLDFGTLAPFGVESDAIGTPPLMAPEVLEAKPLDQRADLYTLGAFGYWMLTSAHAFRAGTLGELPRLWAQAPPRPSELAKLLGTSLPEIPEELDALILALLSRDRDLRPASSLDVIDRLQAIANLPPDETHAQIASAYLASKAFVGREDIVERFHRRLKRANKGRPQALWVEGEEGMGRSRLLEELSMLGRLQGTLVVDASGADSKGPYDAASTLTVKLFEACPELAKAAAEHASALYQVSPNIRATLERAGFAPPTVASAVNRAAKQQALRELFCGVARKRPLLLVADDIARMDEESQALIAALPFVTEGERLMLVTSCQLGAEDHTGGTLATLRRGSAVASLPALTQQETQLLLESIFGHPPHLERIATRLYGLTGGNPQHCLLLVEHLVESGAARYADGSWDLPKDVPAQGLPTSLRATVARRLERLDADARALSRQLSMVEQDHMPGALVEALIADTGQDPQRCLEQLVAARVLAKTDGSLRFTHAVLRETLRGELTEAERREVDAHLARWFQQETSDILIQPLRAALHWLRAGELDLAQRLMCETLDANPDMTANEALRDAAPMIAELVDGLSAAGRSDASLVAPLALLCAAGYFVEPQYTDRYAERGVQSLLHLVPTNVARTLRRFVGRKLALVVLLVIASRRVRKTPFAPPLQRLLQLFVTTTAALCGAEATRMQPARAHTYADALEPLTALGERHIVTAAYRMSRELARSAEDASAVQFRSMERLVAWLERDEPIKGAPPEAARPFLIATRFVWGLRGNFLDNDIPLRAAELLEGAGPVYQLNAYQLRAMYHTSRGEWEQAELYRKRMGVQAIQMGMSWRTDVAASAITMPAIWARDAVALKRAADQLERLGGEMPGYRFHERAVRAAYHVVRGTPEKAVALLKDDATPPLSLGGWTRTRGVLAAAYNAVGEHQKALEVCDHALSYLTPEDLEFVGLTVTVQVEHALAMGKLGREEEATREIEALLQRHADRGPLLRAYLLGAAAQLALEGKHFARCYEHVEQGELLARQTNSPGQLLHFKEIDYQRRLAESPVDPNGDEGPLRAEDEHLALRVQLMLRTALQDPQRLTGKLASIASEITGAATGFFVLPNTEGDAGVVALQNGMPDPRVLSWVRERMQAEDDDNADTTASTTDEPLEDPNELRLGEVRYCLKTFWSVRDGTAQTVGALVLGFSDMAPMLPREDVLTVMSDCLTRIARSTTRDTTG